MNECLQTKSKRKNEWKAQQRRQRRLDDSQEEIRAHNKRVQQQPAHSNNERMARKQRKKERMTSLPTKVSRTTLPIYADFHSPRPFFCFFQSIEEKKKTSSTYCICPTHFLRLDFLRRIRFIPPAEAKWMMRRQFRKSQIATTPFPWR